MAFPLRTFYPLVLALITLLAAVPPADAQGASGCSAPATLADGNVLIVCRRLKIEIEKGADFQLSPGRPLKATLTSGAVYIEDQSKGGRDAFQIRTPDAIASVRGTVWATDVNAKQTSVFVAAGAVLVQRGLDGQSVTLRAGDGVDVAPDAAPLVVKRWAPPRVAALLARFGR